MRATEYIELAELWKSANSKQADLLMTQAEKISKLIEAGDNLIAGIAAIMEWDEETISKIPVVKSWREAKQ